MTTQTGASPKDRLNTILRKLGVEQLLAPALEQLGRVWPLLAITLALTLQFLLILTIVALAAGIRLSTLTMDPAATSERPFYLGMISVLGLMLWAGSAAICWFSWLLLESNPKTAQIRLFFLCSGLVTVMLLVDDAFLFHEVFFPEYLSIPEKVILAGYLLLLGSYLFYFRRLILATDYLLLLAALLSFGLSLVIDVVLPTRNWITFIEDSFKFIGISFWLTYFISTARALVRLNLS
jgi:hypothetical protein